MIELISSTKIQSSWGGIFSCIIFRDDFFKDEIKRFCVCTSQAFMVFIDIPKMICSAKFPCKSEFRSLLLVEDDIVLSGDFDGNLRSWDFEGSIKKDPKKMVLGQKFSIMWSLKKIGDYMVAIGGDNGSINIVCAVNKNWNKVEVRKYVREGQSGYMWCLARMQAKENEHLVFTGHIKSLQYLDLNAKMDKSELKVFNDTEHLGTIYGITSFFQLDREYLVSCGNQSCIFVWDLEEKFLIRKIPFNEKKGGTRTINRLDSDRFAIGGTDGRIRIFDSSCLQFSKAITTHGKFFGDGSVYFVELDPERKFFVSGSYSPQLIYVHNVLYTDKIDRDEEERVLYLREDEESLIFKVSMDNKNLEVCKVMLA